MDTITNAIMCKLAIEKHEKWTIQNKTTGNSQTEDSNATYKGEKELTKGNTSLTDNRPLNDNSRVDDDTVIFDAVILTIVIFAAAFISDVIFNTTFFSNDNYIGSWL